MFIIVLFAGTTEATDTKQPETYITYDNQVRSTALSADSRYLATGDCDGKIRLYDLVNQTTVWQKKIDNNNCIYSIAISSDGQYIVTGHNYNSSAAKVYLFGKDSSTPIWSYDTGSNRIVKVAISLDGTTIAAVAMDGNGGHDLYSFDVSSSTPLWSNSLYDPGQVGLEVSSDGSYIVYHGRVYDNSNQYMVRVYYAWSSTPIFTATTGSTSGLSGGATASSGAFSSTLLVAPTQATSATVASGDVILIADIDDSNNLKKTTAGDIAGLAGGVSLGLVIALS